MSVASRVEVIESNEQPETFEGQWLGMIAYAAFSFAMLAFMLFHKDMWLALPIGVFFAAFGVIGLAMMTWRTLEARKYGYVSLELQPPMPALGGRLHGLIRLPEAAARAGNVEAELACTRLYGKGKDRARMDDWAQVWRFAARADADTVIVFELPAEEPSPQGIDGAKTVTWQLQVTAEVPGIDFSRTFDIPMLPAQPGKPLPPLPAVTRWTPASVPPVQPEALPPQAQAARGGGFFSMAVLVALNLLPIYGVLRLGWKTGDIVWLYWYENVVIGVVNVLRILVSEPRDTGGYAARGLMRTGARLTLAKLFLAAFFIVHYGTFCLAHGWFVASLFGTRSLGSHDAYLMLAIAAFAVSHLISLFQNYLGNGEYQRVDFRLLMTRPYARIFVVHTYILVAGLALRHGSGAAIVAFIAVKIAIDAYMHRRERALLAQ